MNNRASTEIEALLEAARGQGGANQTDGQLLAQFLARRDEAAFALLVKRHGAMVRGVCQRILGNAADADDAFQATFLILVRRAAALTARPVLGDFLHGVARRTALNARRVAALRRRKEEAAARAETREEAEPDERLALLDESLSRLPEKYRLAIVLCDLEGWTRREAAARLGWAEGTVAGRLARGRSLLARRLTRQGISVALVSLKAAIAAEASAGVPASLVSSTLKAARGTMPAPVAALVEGVLKSMLLSKLKLTVSVFLLFALLGAGATAGVRTYLAEADAPPTSEAKEDRAKPARAPREKKAQAEPKEKIPEPEDRIRAGDLLTIRAVGNLIPDRPLNGVHRVEGSGKVALPGYGRVLIKGLTLEEAEAAIHKHMGTMIKEPPAISVARPIPADPALEPRVERLEKEVRELRVLIEEMRKKPRD